MFVSFSFSCRRSLLSLISNTESIARWIVAVVWWSVCVSLFIQHAFFLVAVGSVCQCALFASLNWLKKDVVSCIVTEYFLQRLQSYYRATARTPVDVLCWALGQGGEEGVEEEEESWERTGGRARLGVKDGEGKNKWLADTPTSSRSSQLDSGLGWASFATFCPLNNLSIKHNLTIVCAHTHMHTHYLTNRLS